MYTVLWKENHQKKWDLFEEKEDVVKLLNKLKNNPNVDRDSIKIFTPASDKHATNFYQFMWDEMCS